MSGLAPLMPNTLYYQVDVMRQAAKALVEGTEAESSWSDEAVDAAVALLGEYVCIYMYNMYACMYTYMCMCMMLLVGVTIFVCVGSYVVD